MSDIKKIIAAVEELRPIPQITHKVLSIVEDPLSSTSDLAEVILYDQVITATILKMCNSAYFALPRKIDSIQQAITYLGMDQIVDMAILKMGCEHLKQEQVGYDLEEGELWKHSVASALIARNMAEMKQLKSKHAIFTASLLKDIGKVILNKHVAESFKEIDRLVRSGGLSFREAEKAVIGIDHAEIGGFVAHKWHFSSRMIEMVRNHHLAEKHSEDDVDSAIVYLADILCMMMGIGVGSDGLAYRFRLDALETLNFSEKDLQHLIASFGADLRQVEELIAFT
jgi:putative nucleotidyltransferase with HDIG domain